MLWDIFCKVIDNYGDVGVCWRLATQLAQRDQRVRLWLDEPATAAGAAPVLSWMAPAGHAHVQVLRWPAVSAQSSAPAPGDVVIEAFGCTLPDGFVSAMAQQLRAHGRQPAWLNLEYLTAEAFAQRNHGLTSPVMQGAGAGLTKHFFYPGFTRGTGGLLHEPGLPLEQAAFDAAAWRQNMGVPADTDQLISLFCYEPAALPALLDHFLNAPCHTHLLVAAGRATAALEAAFSSKKGRKPGFGGRGLLSISYLPWLTQTQFDQLLWACDINFVRGEDSLVRALLAGKPLVWQLYPQDDTVHHAKLQAFMDWLAAPDSLREFHNAWNGVSPVHQVACLRDAPSWQICITQARRNLLAQPDLTTQQLELESARAA